MRLVDSVLLIDDDNDTNFINRRLIEKLDVANEVFVATGSKEAIQLIMSFAALNYSRSPELILVDVNMSGLSGFDFFDIYSNIYFTNRKNVRIIFLTSSTDRRDINKIENEFNLTLITKPLTEDKLMGALTLLGINPKGSSAACAGNH